MGGLASSNSLQQQQQQQHKTTAHLPRTDNQWLDILRGCFVGSRNDRVVAALKIVYMDYAALRLAGDLIFKLMSKIVG